MSLPICREDGCENLGVFTLVDSDGVTSALCFDHYAPTQAIPRNTYPEDQTPAFHTDVTAGFAELLLRMTSIAMSDEEAAITEAMTLMVSETMLSADICSGFLLASTALVAIGEISEEALLKLAEQYKLQAEWEDQGPPPPADTVESMVPGPGSDGSSDDGVDPDDDRDAMADETSPEPDGPGEDNSNQTTSEEHDEHVR